MLSNFRLKIGICFLLIISSVLSACGTSQDEGISSESNNPKKRKPIQGKKFLIAKTLFMRKLVVCTQKRILKMLNHRKCQHKM